MADKISIAPPRQPSPGLVSPKSTFSKKDGVAAGLGEETFKLRDDSPPPNNNFAFTPTQLNRLSAARSLTALKAFGGLPGLAAGLRTDLAAGLSIDEATLDGTVRFEEAVAAGNDHRPAKITELPAPSPAQAGGGGQDHAFKLDLADLGVHQAAPRGYVDRRRVFGENRLPKRKQKSFLRLAWIAFNDKLMFLLTISATISLALGIYETVDAKPEDGPRIQWVDGVTVVVAILVIVVASATTDWQKNQKFARLNGRKEQRDVKVVRSGKTQNISVHDLLVGDVIHIETGDVVAVDGVLIQGSGIQVDESSLSGESDLVHKSAAAEVEAEAGAEVGAKEAVGRPSVHRVSATDPFILSGTTVNGGVGNYLVISVGTNSTFGRTLMSLRHDVEETPLQQKLGKLAKQLITVGATAGLVFFLIMFIRFLVRLPTMNATPSEKAMTFFKTLILTVTVVVVTVPEGLALAVTLALAFATSRMLRDNNLVRLIRSCEVMGNATCICSDKTGTLTQNVMTVVAGNIGVREKFGDAAELDGTSNTGGDKGSTSGSDTPTVSAKVGQEEKEAAAVAETGPATMASPARPSAEVARDARATLNSFAPEVKSLLKSGVVLNTTAFESDDPGGDGFIGMSTETALLKFAREHLAMGPLNEERANAATKIVDMFPFDASNKWMAVMCKMSDGRFRMFVKGAAEVVLDKCVQIISDPRVGLEAEPLSEATKDGLNRMVESYAVKMLRPVAMAYRDLADPTDVFEDVKDPTSIDFKKHFKLLTFIGIMGIKDPLRPEVIRSVKVCQEAGVFVRMVTGDNFLTAKAIATECGIYTPGGIAMDGPTFRRLTPAQLDLVIPRLQVLARSSSEDKLLLVSHLKGMQETVAVTGDGTNDALALKAADVGFAMGVQGTEVAKEAASIILLDDNFASIVKALSWGRTVNDAVRKFLQFQFTINITAGILTVVSELTGDAIFTVVQLLWMNLIMDIFASLGLATDYPSPDFLQRKPQPHRAPLVSITMWKMILGQAAYQLVVIFTLHYSGPALFRPVGREEEAALRTMVFNIYVWMQFFNQHNCRRVDNKFNIWYQGVLQNPWFLGVQCATLAGQMVIIWKGGDAFDTTPLSGSQWGWSILFGFLVIPLGALLRCVPDRHAAAALRFFVAGLGFVGKALMAVVPARWNKAKRERKESEGKAAREDGGGGAGGGGDDGMGAMEAWVLQTGAALLRPVNYEWGTSTPPSPRGASALAGRVSSIPQAQREALTRAARAEALGRGSGRIGEGDVDLLGLIEGSRFGGAPGGSLEGQLQEQQPRQYYGLEVHPGTSKDDPILLTEVDVDESRKVPPSQDPEVVRWLDSQHQHED